MPPASSILGGLEPGAFLREYWQKKPLLVRRALPGYESPLSPQELAGLACEDDVDARLVMEEGGEYPWQVRYGPFEEEDFLGLPESHWTLLVQEVDRLLPEVGELLEAFRFIPDWRIDDVMVSYAPPHGGVGAHIDNYDVFLLQGLGRRRWQIGREPVGDERLVPDLDVRVLQDFQVDDEWVLEPGDLLYLPPRFPHYGVALDDCMTFSVGFRAPSDEEVVTGYVAHVARSLDPLDRYSDPDLEVPENPAEISHRALQRIRDVVAGLVVEEEIDRWFGAYITEPRRGHFALPLDAPYTIEEMREVLKNGALLRREPATRFAFIRHRGGAASLFVSGEEYLLDEPLAFAAPLLAGRRTFPAEVMRAYLSQDDFVRLVADLVNEGFLVVEE